jgi:hypothetical protein
VGRPAWLRDPANVRLVRLFLDKGNGHWTKAELLLPAAWATMGQKVWLGLPEMGAVGWAEVRAVEPCPELPPGDGPVVTAFFHHSKGLVYNLLVEGEPEPLGVTPTHPLWSPDRQTWVAAGQLREGERLLAADGGTPRVLGFTKRAQEEEVYNVEVAGDHCYRVGEQGLLVHNASVKGDAQACSNAKNSLKTKAASSGTSIDERYQRQACGSTEYLVVGGGEMIWADAIDACTVVDCKAVDDPKTSPQLGNATVFFTQMYKTSESAKISRYAAIISDPCTPWDKLVIRVNDSAAIPFWKGLLGQVSITSDVVNV